MKDYYKEISEALTRLENGYYTTHSLDWCISHIDWAWKWRKITEGQKDELCDRVCTYLDTH